MITRLMLLGAGVVAAAAGAAALAKRRERQEITARDAFIEPASGRPASTGDAKPTAELDGDDLQSIKGIGKVSEEHLRSIGITTFAQIEAWSPEELEDVAAQIEVSPQRIRREDWVGQAQNAGPSDS